MVTEIGSPSLLTGSNLIFNLFFRPPGFFSILCQQKKMGKIKFPQSRKTFQKSMIIRRPGPCHLFNNSCGAKLSPSAINAVQQSWSTLKQKVGSDAGLAIPMLVFKNFFGDNPSTIKYFKRFGDSAEAIMQHKTFKKHAEKNVFASLDKAIGILNDPEEVKKVVAWIGSIHKPKNIAREDFSNLGDSIVKSVKEALGNELSMTYEDAWRTVIAELMCSFAEIASK